MGLHKLSIEIQTKVKLFLRKDNKNSLEDELKIFSEELKKYFSENDLDKLARKIGFVKRKGRLRGFKINNWSTQHK